MTLPGGTDIDSGTSIPGTAWTTLGEFTSGQDPEGRSGPYFGGLSLQNIVIVAVAGAVCLLTVVVGTIVGQKCKSRRNSRRRNAATGKTDDPATDQRNPEENFYSEMQTASSPADGPRQSGVYEEINMGETAVRWLPSQDPVYQNTADPDGYQRLGPN